MTFEERDAEIGEDPEEDRAYRWRQGARERAEDEARYQRQVATDAWNEAERERLHREWRRHLLLGWGLVALVVWWLI